MANSILKGITELKLSGLPGTITTGSGVTAVVSVDGSAIIAVTTIGKGKVVAMSHDGFTKNDTYPELMKNITEWLVEEPAKPEVPIAFDGNQFGQGGEQFTDFEESQFGPGGMMGQYGNDFAQLRGQFSDCGISRFTQDGTSTLSGVQFSVGNISVLEKEPTKPKVQYIMKDTTEIEANTNVLIFNGAYSSSAITEEQIKIFVENGGGFIHAVTPWGWRMLNGNKPINLIPYFEFMKANGIEYTGKTLRHNRLRAIIPVGQGDESGN